MCRCVRLTTDAEYWKSVNIFHAHASRACHQKPLPESQLVRKEGPLQQGLSGVDASSRTQTGMEVEAWRNEEYA